MRRLAIASVLVSTLAAGEAVSPPVVTVVMPDCARTQQRLQSGPFGKIWALPAVQKLSGESAKGDPESAVWQGLVEHAKEFRFALRLKAGEYGQPEPLLVMAVRVPPGQDPKPIEGMAVGRNGDWLTLSPAEGAAPDLPELPGDALADLRLAADFTALGATLPERDRNEFKGVVSALGLSRLVASVTAGTTGIHEEFRLEGAKLPFKAVDPTALAGLPAQPLAVFAFGVDGQALTATVHAIAKAVNNEADLATADGEMQKEVGHGLDAILAATDGTVVLAVLPGMPFPGFVASFPATPVADAIIAKALGEGDAEAGKAPLEAARTAGVPFPERTPIPIVMRRTATRWLIGSDMVVMEEMSADKPAPFPSDKLWPNAKGAVGLAWGDTQAQVRMLSSVIPMAMSEVKDPAMRKQIMLLQSALASMLPLLPPAALVVTRDDKGLLANGENGLFSAMVPGAVVAGMALPAISLVREQAQRTKAGSTMRQLMITCLAYENESDGKFPKDLDELVKWSDGDITPRMFQDHAHPEIKSPYLYVRPDPQAKSMQPVLIQDPRCNKGKGSMVCYADGHTAFVKGTAVWDEGKRLAALPKAADGGIEFADWNLPAEVPAP